MYAIIDIESTGGGFKGERMIEIAAYIFDGKKIVDEFHTLVNPGIRIPSFITGLTGISDSMVKDAPTFSEIAAELEEITRDCIFVAHNVLFDYGFVKQEFRRTGRSFERQKLCTVKLAQELLPGHDSYSLGNLCKDLKIRIKDRHRATGDALATVKLFKILLRKDHKNLILNMARYGHSEFAFAPNVDWRELMKLPETTGVFYFHDKDGKVIFVGKSTDIRARTLMYLNHKPVNSKKQKMYRDTHSVTYEETGSELVAALCEFIEIRKLNPVFNKGHYIRGFKYGMVSFNDKQGYARIAVKKLERGDKPVAVFEKEDLAKEDLHRRIAALRLCPHLCGRGRKRNPCLHYQTGNCDGACEGEEKQSYYNAKVQEALKMSQYKKPNFLIIGEGREMEERTVIAIRNGSFHGLGYFDLSELKGDMQAVSDSIRKIKSSREINKIVLAHLRKNRLTDIVNLK